MTDGCQHGVSIQSPIMEIAVNHFSADNARMKNRPDLNLGEVLIFLAPTVKTTELFIAVASWLVRSSPDRTVRVRALAGDIVLCSWVRHLALTVPLSTQVYSRFSSVM